MILHLPPEHLHPVHLPPEHLEKFSSLGKNSSPLNNRLSAVREHSPTLPKTISDLALRRVGAVQIALHPGFRGELSERDRIEELHQTPGIVSVGVPGAARSLCGEYDRVIVTGVELSSENLSEFCQLVDRGPS